MADCCKVPAPSRAASCPMSGTPGRSLSRVTLESLLDQRARELVRADQDYFFCPAPSCAVVYFSGDGEQVFKIDELTVPVWQKSPEDPDVPVCYCFAHTPATIRHELQVTGKSMVVASITAKVKEGLCACERNNPQGSCCLGNVNSVVKTAKASLEMPGAPVKVRQ